MKPVVKGEARLGAGVDEGFGLEGSQLGRAPLAPRPTLVALAAGPIDPVMKAAFWQARP
jgi:hypothetical protein